MEISLTINNQSYSADIEPRTLLVDLLRDNLGLTGTKVGCDTGQCGSCNILLNGKSVKSCMLLAVQADGAEVMTVEGLAAKGRLNNLQEGFQERHGTQCGFCTPGMLISLTELLNNTPEPTEQQIRAALEGNLCRCTGYQNVIDAVKYAVEKSKSPVKMIVDTPGKRFYQRQVEYLVAGNADALVEDNYNDDAVLTSPEFIIKGKQALKVHFRNYMRWVKIKAVKSTDKFVETDNTVLFEATVESNYGEAKVYDAFVLRNGRIAYHFTGVM